MLDFVFFLCVFSVITVLALTFPGDTPWRGYYRKKREAKLHAEEEALGYKDPASEVIVKLLKTDVAGWEVATEYEMRHTSGIIIKHHDGSHASLLTWYYPGYGYPESMRRKDGYTGDFSYDQRKILEAIRVWKKLKAHDLFKNTPRSSSE
jgi:hypothetical protein